MSLSRAWVRPGRKNSGTAANLAGQGLTSVSGLITDPSGAVVLIAKTTLANIDTAVSREAE